MQPVQHVSLLLTRKRAERVVWLEMPLLFYIARARRPQSLVPNHRVLSLDLMGSGTEAVGLGQEPPHLEAGEFSETP